jgi:glycosyltransferase involved in cell wall biosynthesis
MEDILRPCVSVVIPAFNCENFVSETLESVRNQTMRDWEIIIVDDSSSDKGVEVIERFIASESRTIKLVKNKYGKGVAGSLNTAIELAEGKYLARLDADDICKNDRFEKQIRYLDENNLDICGSAIEFFDSAKGKFAYPISDEAIRSKILIENPFAHPSVMFSIGKLSKSEIVYDEKFKGLEDVDLWSRLMQNKEFIFGNHPEALLRYRVHQLQKSRTDSRTVVRSDMEQVIARLLSRLDIQLSEREMQMYIGNWYEQPLKNMSELTEFKKLLEKIYKANISKKSFNDEFLREYLCVYWFKSCKLFSKSTKLSTKDILVSIEIPNDWYKFNRSMLKYFVKDYLLRLTHK